MHQQRIESASMIWIIDEYSFRKEICINATLERLHGRGVYPGHGLPSPDGSQERDQPAAQSGLEFPEPSKHQP